MSELEILRSEIEALKKEIEALRLENQALKTENKELKDENVKLTDTIKREASRCFCCDAYGAEERYISKVGTRMVCNYCYNTSNHKWW